MINHSGKTEGLEDLAASDDFHAGPLCIEKMRVYALCSKKKAYTDDIRVEFDPREATQRPLPKEWPHIEATVLEQLKKQAKERRALFNDGPQVDMVSAHIERPEDRDPTKPNTIIVNWAKTTYFPFAAMSNRLDKEVDGLPTSPAPVTLRHLWTGGRPIGLYDVHELQSPAVIGTVAVVVTKDDRLLVHYRSEWEYHVRGGVHFVGEGMLPKDCKLPEDCKSKTPYDPPCQTVKRALREELGLADKVIEDTQVIPTAFVFDTQRWQPVFCYIAQIPRSRLDVQSPTRDSFKVLAFRLLDSKNGSDVDRELRELLLGRDPSRHLSSNHASMALYAALVWQFGLDWASPHQAHADPIRPH